MSQLDDYLESVVLPDDGGADTGEWLVCSACEGAWRPCGDTNHKDGCPVAELRKLQVEHARVRASIVAEAAKWLRSDAAARSVRGLIRGTGRDQVVLDILAADLLLSLTDAPCPLPPTS